MRRFLLVAAVCALPVLAQAGLPSDLAADVASLATPATAWWLAGGAAATAGVHGIENPQRTRDFLDRGAWDFLADRGNLWGDARLQAPLALAVWGAGAWADAPELARTGYDMTRALALTYGVVAALKPLVDRTRPNGEPYSFPSGHTAAAFSAAGVISRRHGGWWGGAGVALGVTTAMGRMEDLKHHASDTVAGAAIGWLCGRNAARSEQDPGLRLAVAPGALALTARW